MFDEVDLKASLRRAHDASSRAQELAAGAPAVERALVDALTKRYPSPEAPEDFTRWNDSYARAMGDVYSAHADDLDVAALYADALMNISPWALWDLRTGAPAEGARTIEAKEVLDAALARPGGMSHPGLLHFYVHLMEMSRHPDDALQAANQLRELIPDAGHLIHMPTHIDVLLGDYHRVIEDNERAIVADEHFVAARGRLNFYSLYRVHNHHFRIYGAMFAGRKATALAAAQ